VARIEIMKALGALTLLVLVIAGCGGTASRNKVEVTQPSGGDCAQKGITTAAAREGTCVANGTKITVVNKAHWLPQEGYDVRVLGVRTVPKVGHLTPATGGRFALLTLAVRNHEAAPLAFDRKSDLAYLLINRRLFPESSSAARAVRGSRDSSIPPSGTGTGTLVFDLPTGFSADIHARGSDLVLLAPNEVGRGFPQKNVPTLGFIRLWQ
jgi:hypothetical protein